MGMDAVRAPLSSVLACHVRQNGVCCFTELQTSSRERRHEWILRRLGLSWLRRWFQLAMGSDWRRSSGSCAGPAVAATRKVRGILRRLANLSCRYRGLRPCASYRARELQALGHEVAADPACNTFAPSSSANKNDAADAEAICEAVTRPTDAVCGGRKAPSCNRTRLMLHAEVLAELPS